MKVGVGLRFRFLLAPSSTEATASLSARFLTAGAYDDVDATGGGGDNDGARASGWLLDIGGTVMSMGWAPSDARSAQLLALTIIPFSDQAFYPDLKKAPRESDMKEGVVQIWRFEADEDSRRIARPAARQPRLAHALCFSWGRATRLQWCPVPLTGHDKVGLLAVLCGDGRVRVLEVPDTAMDSTETFGKCSMGFLGVASSG